MSKTDNPSQPNCEPEHVLDRVDSIARRLGFILFSLLVISVCLLLGNWQLSRAAEKQASLAVKSAVLSSLENVSAQQRHHKITLIGHFDNSRALLLDNQTHNGRSGFNLYLPFTSGNNHILVNLGWLPGTASRQQLPKTTPFVGQFQLHGTLSNEQGSPILLGNNINHTVDWPLLIQRTDIAELQQLLGYPLTPLLLQLDAGTDIGFEKTWQRHVMPAAKHTGYAMQWFGLALAMAICSFYWLRKSSSAGSNKH